MPLIFDGNGHIDVLSASYLDDKINRFKNNGFGIFFTQPIITNMANGAKSVYATDLDGDGDVDILSASALDSKIAWYKNNGSGNFGTQQIISTSASGAMSVYAADLDGDGDIDVLSASANDDKIAWYANNGTGNFGLQQIISLTAIYAYYVYTADLDGDGDMDVLSASYLGNKLVWYENTGTGFFGPRQKSFQLQFFGMISLYAADLDNDGDVDVLSASANDDKIAWYENYGTGNFGLQQIISTSSGSNGPRSVYAADLDGDGDLDVLSASHNDNIIAWYENLLTINVQVSVNNSPCIEAANGSVLVQITGIEDILQPPYSYNWASGWGLRAAVLLLLMFLPLSIWQQAHTA